MEGTHRARDVLDLLKATINKLQIAMLSDMIADGARHANSARIGYPFQSSCNVDRVSEDIPILNNHIAHIETDPELELICFGHLDTFSTHGLLDVDCTIHRGKRARESGYNAVACGIDDHSALFDNNCIDRFSGRPQP